MKTTFRPAASLTNRPAESTARPATHPRTNALIALLLLVPVPTIGVWCGLYSEGMRGSDLGQSIYFASKLWILLMPAFWLLLVEGGRITWSPVRHQNLFVGVVSGVVLSALIVVGWLAAGPYLIDPEMVRATAAASGLGSPLRYGIFALYICTINAVIEEYVWRWFVYRKSETLLGKAGIGAVLLSAAFFTVHHFIALMAQFTWLPAILASAGVFIGGCVWSALYLRFRSIWPGFASHVLVDITIFLIGASILFGA